MLEQTSKLQLGIFAEDKQIHIVDLFVIWENTIVEDKQLRANCKKVYVRNSSFTIVPLFQLRH